MAANFSQETQLAACIHINAVNVVGLEFQKQLANIEGVVLAAVFLQWSGAFQKRLL